MSDFDNKNQVQVVEVSYENLHRLKDFITLHNKWNCQECFYVSLDDSSCIFDRGKYAVVPPIFFGKLILSCGFQSDFGL